MPDGVTGTAESNGFSISSNFETSEAMAAALAPPPEAAETSAGTDAAPASERAETAAPAADTKPPKPRNDPRARVE